MKSDTASHCAPSTNDDIVAVRAILHEISATDAAPTAEFASIMRLNVGSRSFFAVNPTLMRGDLRSGVAQVTTDSPACLKFASKCSKYLMRYLHLHPHCPLQDASKHSLRLRSSFAEMEKWRGRSRTIEKWTRTRWGGR
mmetsp:Transcript_26202/g.36492  ORF Transcript_26202/g.36492 Transcript_26202/m.36492 type:complete len:139 (+) Transcript_26202:416-832(+)